MAEHRVQSPLGSAALSLDHIELNVQFSPSRSTGPEIRGDRAIVRSTVSGQPAFWAVFERAATQPGWSQVTADLTADQVANWTSHRVTSGSKSLAFDEWLTTEVEASEAVARG